MNFESRWPTKRKKDFESLNGFKVGQKVTLKKNRRKLLAPFGTITRMTDTFVLVTFSRYGKIENPKPWEDATKDFMFAETLQVKYDKLEAYAR